MSEDKAQYYIDNWDYMNQLINGAPYRADRQAALDKYGDEAYNLAMEVLNERGNKNPLNLLNGQFKDKASTDYSNLQAITGEDTEKFLQYVQEKEDEKATFNRNLEFQEMLGEHPTLAGVGGTILSDVGEVISGPIAMGEFTRSTGYADKNAPVNVYSDRYALKNLDRGIQSAVTERIGLDSMIAGDSELTTRAKQALYGMGNSTVTSGLSIAIGGALGKALQAVGTSAEVAGKIAEAATLTEFSTNAFTTTYQEQIEKGINDRDAIRTAVVSGVAEAFFERYSLESLHNMYFARKAGETGLRNTIAQLISQGLVEGSEEVFTDLANYYGDYLINGGFSEYSQLVKEYEMNGMSHEEAVKNATLRIAKNMGVSFIGGTFSGLLLGTGTTVASAVNVSNAAHTIVDTPELSAVKDNILETARQQAENTTARKVVDELDASNKEATAGDIAKIIESEISIGQEETSTKDYIAEMVDSVEGLSEKEKKDAVKTIMNSLNTKSEKVTEEQEQKLTETLDKDEKLSDAYAKAVTGEYAPASNTVNTAMSAAKAVQESNKAKAKLESSYESGKNKGLAAVKVDDKTGTVSKILKDGQIETYVKGRGFLTRKIESVMYASSNVSQVHNALSYDSVINADHATTLAAQYKSGIPARTWLRGVRTAYLEGAANTGTIESLLSNGKNTFASVVPQETLAMAYALGKQSANTSSGNNITNLGKRVANPTVSIDNSVKDNVSKELNSLSKWLAHATGVNIKYTDFNPDGSEATYDPETREITVALFNLNPKGEVEATDVLRALGHEVTGEYFQSVNAEGYKNVRDMAIGLYEKLEGSTAVNNKIKHIMDVYRNSVEAGKTMEEAADELANNLISEIIFSKDGAQALIDAVNENFSETERKNIFEQIIDYINAILEDIKNFFSENKGIAAVASEKDLKEIRDMFKAEFAKGIKNDIGQSKESNDQKNKKSKAEKVEHSVNTESYSDEVVNSISMEKCKQMIQRAFNNGNIKEWYDGEYKNGDEWIKEAGVDEVVLYIENDYQLQQLYLNGIQAYIDGEIMLEEILEAYLDNALKSDAKKTVTKSELAKINVAVADNRFYAPKEVNNARELYETAIQKKTKANGEEVDNARAQIILFAHNKNAAETLGIAETELNKKLRQWSRYSAKAREISMRINADTAIANRWTGIENMSLLNRWNISEEEIERMVKAVTGRASQYEKNYIGRTMLAYDTHIDWSWLSINFATNAEVNEGRKGNRCNGYYSNSDRAINTSINSPHTVAHEMSHALDYQWGRDFGSGMPLTEYVHSTDKTLEEKHSGEVLSFLKEFRSFTDSLAESSDITNEYWGNIKETFARFGAKFVEWSEKIATGTSTSFSESRYERDKFTQAQFVTFARLLQTKAALDTNGLTKNTIAKKMADITDNVENSNIRRSMNIMRRPTHIIDENKLEGEDKENYRKCRETCRRICPGAL